MLQSDDAQMDRASLELKPKPYTRSNAVEPLEARLIGNTRSGSTVVLPSATGRTGPSL